MVPCGAGRVGLPAGEGRRGRCGTSSSDAARASGLTDYGLREGAAADLVLLDAPDEKTALIENAPRLLVLKAGRPVAGGLRPVRPAAEEKGC